MNKLSFNTVVVIPVGPTCVHANVCDTIESVIHYMDMGKTKIILADDTENSSLLKIKSIFPCVEIIKNNVNQGKNGGLYVTLSKAFLYAYSHYKFNLIIRLDTDALIIGESPEFEAKFFFNSNKKIGSIGSYKYSYDKKKRDFSWAKRQLLIESSPIVLLKGYKKFHLMITLDLLLFRALVNGYRLGEHCMGGVAFYSYDCVAKLARNNLLQQPTLAKSSLQEDMIFGLLIKSVGMTLSDFPDDLNILGVQWKGLPDDPKRLYKKFKIIHSVKYFHKKTESQIRGYFLKRRRQKDA